MELFERLEDMGHERVLLCSNPDVGLKAIIAVHSTTLGPGLGGLRMWPFKDFDEALTDVLRLSRGMTYKAAAAGLHLGGGKAVILGDPKSDKSEALFRSFGRYVESLERPLHHRRGRGHRHGGHGGHPDRDPLGHRSLARPRWQRRSLPGDRLRRPARNQGGCQLENSASLPSRAAPWPIQGLGSVGYHLAKYLADEGAKVFGSDIDPDENRQGGRASSESRSSRPTRSWKSTATSWRPARSAAGLDRGVHPQAALRHRCRRRQQPAARRGASTAVALHERDILYAPDFVINAGGLINVYNELTGDYNQERALRMTRGIYLNLMRVFEISKEEKVPTYVAADRMAEERIATIKQLGSRHWGRFINNH